MPKSVKVHDDTHRALKEMKASRRDRSIDKVIRDMIEASTGERVGKTKLETKSARLTSYFED